MSVNTKKDIKESLISVLKDNKNAKISVSKVCRKCGINRQTFYYHFNNIEELMNWAFIDTYADILKKSQESDDYNLQVKKFVTQMKEDSFFIMFLSNTEEYRYKALRYLKDPAYTIARNYVKFHLRNYELSKVNLEFLTSYIAGGIMNVLFDWINDGLATDSNVVCEKISYCSNNLIRGTLENLKNSQAN